MELVQITSIEQLRPYKDDWSFILEENQNTNPFIEFVWIYEWWKHLGDESPVEIIVVKKNEKPVAFFPFLCKKGLFGYTYTFMAFGQANYMDFVVYDHLLDSVIEFVFDEIIRIRKNVVFYLHGLLESSRTPNSLEAYLQNRNSFVSIHRVITPYINLEKIKLEEYMEKRKKLHRLDRREKRLRDSGQVEFLQSRQDEMERIFKLHDKRWAKRHDTSGFTKEKEKGFYRSLAQIKDGPMKTEIDSLYINNTMIAFNYGFTCRGRYLGYVLGYDDDFEVFGPGRILEKEKVFQCKKNTVNKFDLSIGYEPYKFEWNTHLDYTRRMIFSSDSIISKTRRYLLSMKDGLIERIKENYRLVLFKRNTLGKLLYIIKNLFGKSESKNVREELKVFISNVKKNLYERERYIVYKMEKKDVPDLPPSKKFIELTINDAMDCPNIASKHMKEICKKMYGGYKGYYPEDNLSFRNIFWTNEKVLRIDRISYIEQFRKSSVYFKNWNERNLAEICSSVKGSSKARTVYVAVEEHAENEKAALERIGFSASKQIAKRTYFGFKKYQVIE